MLIETHFQQFCINWSIIANKIKTDHKLILMNKRIIVPGLLNILFLMTIHIMAASACSKEKLTFIPLKNDSLITILFVGNSLTYVNDLPGLVSDKGKIYGINIKTEMLALPNYAISDHWDDGKVQQLISYNKYDFVVIQQGPSSQAEGREILLEYGPKYNDLCKQSGSRLAYFMVWPALANYENFNGVINNYTDAANSTNSILCPVGKIWKEYCDKTNDYSYYGPDQFHPSLKGSEITAEVIVKSVLNL